MNQTIRSFVSTSYKETLSSADIGFDTFDFLPYDRQIKHVERGEKVTEAFTTKELDEEAGLNLNYFGARYYDPNVGLWTSVDTIRQHQSSYTYGSNNPVNRIDPDGNQDVNTEELAMWDIDQSQLDPADAICCGEPSNSFLGKAESINDGLFLVSLGLTIFPPKSTVGLPLMTYTGATSVGIDIAQAATGDNGQTWEGAVVNATLFATGYKLGNVLGKYVGSNANSANYIDFTTRTGQDVRKSAGFISNYLNAKSGALLYRTNTAVQDILNSPK